MACYFCKKAIPYEFFKDKRAVKVLDGKGNLTFAHAPCVGINDLALPRHKKPYSLFDEEAARKANEQLLRDAGLLK